MDGRQHIPNTMLTMRVSDFAAALNDVANEENEDNRNDLKIRILTEYRARYRSVRESAEVRVHEPDWGNPCAVLDLINEAATEARIGLQSKATSRLLGDCARMLQAALDAARIAAADTDPHEITPGLWSVFVLHDDGAWSHPIFRVREPISEQEFCDRATRYEGGFIAHGVSKTEDVDPETVIEIDPKINQLVEDYKIYDTARMRLQQPSDSPMTSTETDVARLLRLVERYMPARPHVPE